MPTYDKPRGSALSSRALIDDLENAEGTSPTIFKPSGVPTVTKIEMVSQLQPSSGEGSALQTPLGGRREPPPSPATMSPHPALGSSFKPTLPSRSSYNYALAEANARAERGPMAAGDGKIGDLSSQGPVGEPEDDGVVTTSPGTGGGSGSNGGGVRKDSAGRRVGEAGGAIAAAMKGQSRNTGFDARKYSIDDRPSYKYRGPETSMETPTDDTSALALEEDSVADHLPKAPGEHRAPPVRNVVQRQQSWSEQDRKRMLMEKQGLISLRGAEEGFSSAGTSTPVEKTA